MRNKELAELQFDVNAAPVNLGIKFESFCSFEINPQIVDRDVDELIGFDLFTDEINELPVESSHLALIANDLDPIERDFEEKKNQNLEEDVEFEDIRNLFLEESDLEVNSSEKIDSVDFKIKHSEIKSSLQDFEPENKSVTAFRLIMKAIDNLSDRMKKKFLLEDNDADEKYYQHLALIDKSMTSIQFINQLGFRVMDQIKTKFPDRFKNFPIDDNAQIDWLNKMTKSKRELDLIFVCAYLSSRLKFSNIEINDNPGFNIGITNYSFFKCHNILRVMHLHTIHPKSSRFRNLEKFVRRFSLVYGGSRLFYLEKLISDAKNGKLFFESHEPNFSEAYGNWVNPSFPHYDPMIFIKLYQSNSNPSS